MPAHEDPAHEDVAPGTRRGKSEPIRKWWIWAGMIVIILLGIPWYLPTGLIEPVVFGLPLWTIVAIGSSILLCVYLSWILRRHWNLVEDEEEAAGSGSDDGSDGAGFDGAGSGDARDRRG